MTRGAIGCAVLGAAAFIALGFFALSMTFTEITCPERLRWAELGYEAVGTPRPEPGLADESEAVPVGSTLIGLESRDVYAPAGTVPGASGDERPDVLALDCGDGTFLAYRAAP